MPSVPAPTATPVVPVPPGLAVQPMPMAPLVQPGAGRTARGVAVLARAAHLPVVGSFGATVAALAAADVDAAAGQHARRAARTIAVVAASAHPLHAVGAVGPLHAAGTGHARPGRARGEHAVLQRHAGAAVAVHRVARRARDGGGSGPDRQTIQRRRRDDVDALDRADAAVGDGAGEKGRDVGRRARPAVVGRVAAEDRYAARQRHSSLVRPVGDVHRALAAGDGARDRRVERQHRRLHRAGVGVVPRRRHEHRRGGVAVDPVAVVVAEVVVGLIVGAGRDAPAAVVPRRVAARVGAPAAIGVTRAVGGVDRARRMAAARAPRRDGNQHDRPQAPPSDQRTEKHRVHLIRASSDRQHTEILNPPARFFRRGVRAGTPAP